MAAPTTINSFWKSVPVPMSSARQMTVSSATATNPAVAIGNVLPFKANLPAAPEDENDSQYITYAINGMKPFVAWPPSTPATFGVFFEIPVPWDIAEFDDGIGGKDVAARLDLRLSLQSGGPATGDRLLRCRVGAEGQVDDPVSNYGGAGSVNVTPDYTYPNAGNGDQLNATFAFSNLRDVNGRSLRPGDNMGVALWWRNATPAAMTYTIYFANFRYRAASPFVGGTKVGSLTEVLAAGTSPNDVLLIVSGGTTKKIKLSELTAAM